MLESRAVICIHTVKETMVGSCGVRQQLRCQWAAWGGPAMVMFQQIPHGGKAVIHGAADDRVHPRNRILYVLSVPCGVLPHVMQEAGQLCHAAKVYYRQSVPGVLTCLPVVIRDRLADFRFIRSADMCREGIVFSVHESSPHFQL